MNSGCPSFQFEPSEGSYYFLTGFLPKGTSYKYDVQSKIVYYKSTDYTQYKQCTARADHACEFDLPQSGSTYDVIVGVETYPPSMVVPLTTHYCLDLSPSGNDAVVRNILK